MIHTANADTALGLYPAGDFRIVTGECRDCTTLRQALWYFRGETIAVARSGLPVASFTRGVETFADLREWASRRDPHAAIDYPPLIWIAAPHVAHAARFDGDRLQVGGESRVLRPVAKIPMNRAYYDASSAEFLRAHSLTVRGIREGDAFVMRSVWPDDFAIGPAAPPVSPATDLRRLMREEPQGGARSPYLALTLWQRDATAARWAGKPVLAFVANGAQADDDEAHAGHFAIATGRIARDGRIGNWLVGNFYSLDSESEKGIIAAPVPLDNYQGDLNSGQSWYRPSYLIVLVLRDPRAPALAQSAINRVYNQFYRHRLLYYHPDVNCTSISIDTLRAVGWPVPTRGPSNRLLGWIALRKLTRDYLRAEQTRLLPAVAFEEVFADALRLAQRGANAADGTLARMLAEDIDAIAYARIPQIPSSRGFGDAPVVSLAEYRRRVPRDRAQQQIIPLPPRPFPDELRDSDL